MSAVPRTLGAGPPAPDFRTPETEAHFAQVQAALAVELDLIGVLLNSPEAIGDADRLMLADFYEGEGGLHAQLLAAIRADAAAGHETSLHLMQSRFGHVLDAAGAPTLLADAWDKAPPLSSLSGLVAQIATAASQRRLMRTLSRPGVTPTDLDLIVQAEARRVHDITSRTRRIEPSPFVWRDPTKVPAREWLYDRHYIRKFVSATFAPGGVGKSTLSVVEALAMVTGKPLLGVRPSAALRVWLINLEDPREETERRVFAACLHYGIRPDEIEGRLFIDSGRETPVVIARNVGRSGVEVCAPQLRQLEEGIRANGIDVVMIDPFVNCHEVAENDNSAVGVVVRGWAGLADVAACSIELVHHVRKPSGDRAEVTVEDGRGAGALLAGVRSARVINPMAQREAEEWGVEDADRRRHFRVDNGKSNLAPPSAKARWRKLVSVDLENGPVGLSDEVAVATLWEPPSAFADVTLAHTIQVQQRVSQGRYRASEQAAAWVGRAVADVMEWDAADPGQKAKIKRLLASWIAAGLLKVEQQMDEAKREPKPFVVVGKWVSP